MEELSQTRYIKKKQTEFVGGLIMFESLFKRKTKTTGLAYRTKLEKTGPEALGPRCGEGH